MFSVCVKITSSGFPSRKTLMRQGKFARGNFRRFNPSHVMTTPLFQSFWMRVIERAKPGLIAVTA
jgi:hypothetical protein